MTGGWLAYWRTGSPKSLCSFLIKPHKPKISHLFLLCAVENEYGHSLERWTISEKIYNTEINIFKKLTWVLLNTVKQTAKASLADGCCDNSMKNPNSQGTPRRKIMQIARLSVWRTLSRSTLWRNIYTKFPSWGRCQLKVGNYRGVRGKPFRYRDETVQIWIAKIKPIRNKENETIRN